MALILKPIKMKNERRRLFNFANSPAFRKDIFEKTERISP
jgi:hypothetical protein